MNIPQSVRDLLATGPLGHQVTLDPTEPLTSLWSGPASMVTSWCSPPFPDQHKIESIRRDPRVAISFQAHENPGPGLHPYAVISGRARVSEGGALEWMDHLAGIYIGPGQRFPMRNAPPGFVVRVTVDRIYGVGPWGHNF